MITVNLTTSGDLQALNADDNVASSSMDQSSVSSVVSSPLNDRNVSIIYLTPYLAIITFHMRSTTGGYVFTGVCLSLGGGCLWSFPGGVYPSQTCSQGDSAGGTLLGVTHEDFLVINEPVKPWYGFRDV